jgi:4-amino-4-deoxy-L-arabinose transferase-like glycosyltransferase
VGAVSQLPLLLLLWLVLMVAFFSAAATKLPGYILPALPAGSLLVALWWRPLASAGAAPPGPAQSWPLPASGWINAVLLALLSAAAVLASRWAAADPAHPGFASALDRSGLPLRLALLLSLAALAMVLLLIRPERRRWLWLPDLAGFLAVLALVVAPLAPLLDRERQLPLRQLARQARSAAQPDEPLWVVGAKRYSLLFYGGETAAFVSGRGRIEERWRRDPADLGITPTSRSVRLVGDRSDLENLELPVGAVLRLARRGEQELWRVPLEALQP